ncbi:aspartate/glutamate racemase family protein [Phaeobacter gallaeciensis]|jgi:Asp/Glu/hydantoin racemase|uniref:aspartate/glutamate racemase family protein n=1 Tax=Phaeobacter gallaeciensis TaxID=60890 RepID=UPI00237FBB7B|nr:aspartate/glutamate racemase family protein [Phaeobacter gallaeciensis]MDE4303018.1 aspartate/glutamate racemase family protein [Phaeobacter gallaeciensis]MDE4307410.1 aspartate/glutamate racemase family protein [Phaeobacter gallaeciensis]MDE4311868.1 aspartate/glutamate racemase family protein [Phaeobacter gallaeciensis]MDE4316627.1 aspartate/glutamate racemase family protein [Phaeobacter gallaeciensis]MDE4320802.1 aspartate/glutamate racemase family protein [Phaeobacter gallaeciensis]
MERGGKTVYGATVGILMLETQFPRVHGDVGNALTWDFPVQYRVVEGASPDRVVRNDPSDLAERFIEAGHDLIRSGCDGITTTCGFLSLIQEEVKSALGVPVATSSLMQVPMVQRLLPAGKRCGVLTISEEALGPEHLAAAGAPPDTPVVGTDGGRCMTRDFLGDKPTIDFAACRLDMIDAGLGMMQSYPDVGAIVLECTNMVPYARDLRKVTGVPVYSIYSFINWFQAGLLPRHFPLEVDDPRWM